MKPVVAFTLACAIGAVVPGALAQTFPSKPVRMYVGYAAGGGADGLARAVAQKLSDQIGQQVIVENRPGASGSVAGDALAKSPPDGYTLYFADTAMLIAPSVYPKVGYDAARSFAPVAGVCTLPLAFVVHPEFAARTTAELIAVLKASPGKHAYGSPGVGTVQHLAAELFRKATGVEWTHVPYKGANPMLADLLGGQIPIGIISAAPALAQARGGKLRTLALTSPQRLAEAPDTPVMAETLSGFDAAPRLFVIAPAGTPQPVVARLSEGVRGALADREVLAFFTKVGATAEYADAGALAERMQGEIAKWGTIAREAGVKAD